MMSSMQNHCCYDLLMGGTFYNMLYTIGCYGISAIGSGLISLHRVAREGYGDLPVHPSVLVDSYPSVQLYPPFEAPPRPAGRGCWVWRRRDVVSRPTAGYYAPGRDAIGADGHVALGAYPSVQLYLPFEAPLPTAGRGCRAWRRRDVGLLSAGRARASACSGGECAVSPRASNRLPVGVRSLRPAVLTDSYPYVQLYPPFEAPLLPAGRGCWVWRRRHVVQLYVRKACIRTHGGAATGTSADFLAPPIGCRGMWLLVRNNVCPFVQLHPPPSRRLCDLRGAVVGCGDDVTWRC